MGFTFSIALVLKGWLLAVHCMLYVLVLPPIAVALNSACSPIQMVES